MAAKVYGNGVVVFPEGHVISTDAQGNTVHTGHYLLFRRDADEPAPTTHEEVFAILRRQTKGEPLLRAIIDKPNRPGKPAAQLGAAILEMVAHPRAAAWKTKRAFKEATGPVKAEE